MCVQPEYKPSGPASLQFWGGMAALAVFWVIMLIFQISQLKYVILIVIALFFVLMNALGYYRCRAWSIQELKAQQQPEGGLGNIMSGLTAGVAQNFMVRFPVTPIRQGDILVGFSTVRFVHDVLEISVLRGSGRHCLLQHSCWSASTVSSSQGVIRCFVIMCLRCKKTR